MTAPATAKDDAQAAKELANLLGRELVQAKQRVSKLEKQLQEKNKALSRKKNKHDDRTHHASGVVLELQQEVDRYKQEESKLKKKIQNLQAKRQNIMNKEKEIKRLRNEVDDLRVQCEIAREEAERSKRMYRDDKRRGEELKEASKSQEKSGTGHIGWSGALSTMSAIPLCLTRPAHGTLGPVAKKGIQLSRYLRSDPKTEKYADAVLFIPGRFAWCTSARGYHHAFAFGPTHIFNTQSRRWESRSVMEHLYGKTRELFYEDKTDVLYAGTYECLQLNTSIINWPAPEVEGLVPYIMAETALSEDFRNAPSTSVHKGTISKLYRDGALELECMGLRCVGFKEELYQDLVTRHQSRSPVKGKRQPETVDDDRAIKRRRV